MLMQEYWLVRATSFQYRICFASRGTHRREKGRARERKEVKEFANIDELQLSVCTLSLTPPSTVAAKFDELL